MRRGCGPRTSSGSFAPMTANGDNGVENADDERRRTLPSHGEPVVENDLETSSGGRFDELPGVMICAHARRSG